MGTFNITSSNLNVNYDYKNSSVVVVGSYQKDAQNDELKSVNGQVYAKDAQGNQGAYIGNFNGTVRNGDIKYSLSEMTKQQSDLVWQAIEEIEPYITGVNNE